ncbi:hypothetical protein Aperf_G00000045189 [Anoplocephala perfoliata]
MANYCAGRFAVPPDFDFRVLPHKGKPVVVITFIGALDSFNNKLTSLLVDDFLKQSPFSLPCPNTTIKGYYDFERKIIFLYYADSEKLLNELLAKPKICEKVLDGWESERLKHLLLLFTISHFIVISTFGISLDPRYVSLLKILNRLRNDLYPSIDSILRSLSVSRYYISFGRIFCPRLLLVFKLPPTIAARNMAKNENVLFGFERSLSLQIFNVFQESGLLDELFTLDGFHTVRILLPDCVEPLKVYSEPYIDRADKDDLAQELLESLISSIGVPSILENCDTLDKRRINPPKYVRSAPGAPCDRSFAAFLEANLTNFMEKLAEGDPNDPHTQTLPELPTTRSWFVTYYKLYTSLFDEGDITHHDKAPESSLSQEWRKIFSLSGDRGSVANSTAVTYLATQSQLDYELSSIRCENAFPIAEAHYRQDLPTHYSRIFHLARVVSSYNVFLSHARGPCVIPSLKDLTYRLARLFLAGRVNCPVLLVSGFTCRQELHSTPQRFPGITSGLNHLVSKLKNSDSTTNQDESDAKMMSNFQLLVKHIKTNLSSSKSPLGSSSKTRIMYDRVISNCLQDVPFGLIGHWQYAWIEGAAGVIEQEKNKIDSALSGIVDNPMSLQHLSVMPHRSERRFISSCNCGRTQAMRLDPYDYKEANWDFYLDLEASCCNRVGNIRLAPFCLSDVGHDLHTKFESSNLHIVAQETTALKASYSGLSQNPEPYSTALLDAVNEPVFLPTPAKQSSPAPDGNDKKEEELANEMPSESGDLFKELDDMKDECMEESVITSLGENSIPIMDKSKVVFGAVEKGEFENPNMSKPVERLEHVADEYKDPMKKEQESPSKSVEETLAASNFDVTSESAGRIEEVEVEKLKQNLMQELKEMTKEKDDQEEAAQILGSNDTYLSLEEPGKPMRQEIKEEIGEESKDVDDGFDFEEKPDRASDMMSGEAAGLEESIVEFRQMKSYPSLEFVEGSSSLNMGKSDPKEPDLSFPLDSSSEKKTMVEFRDCMPVLGQMLNVMPLYPSWSIHCLGKYSSYSHATGIVAPGFLRGSNYLLPKDVSLQAFHESTPTKGRSNRSRDNDSVKLFIGYEAECPLGHRFFLAGVSRPMSGTMQATEVKRAVADLLCSDIPIFTPCRCSPTSPPPHEDSDKSNDRQVNDKTVWAQLMRIYVAIPNALLRVRFAPIVQPGEGCPSFHLGPTLDKLKDLRQDVDSAEVLPSYPGYVNLQDGFIWVLRLPFAYQHDGVVYRRPRDPAQIRNFCLLKSNIQIQQI